jgi:hypothetical protein
VITVSSTGSFKNTEAFLQHVQKLDVIRILETLAQTGVDALEGATPVDTGLAANSWGYEVTRNGGVYTVSWTNSDVENGYPVAIMIQYGHGTGTGGYIQGQDYINPAIKPVFDAISDKIWKAVTSA